MSLRPYLEYKDSGVPWLREIPSHWSVSQSRRLFAQRKERATPADIQLTASQKYGILYQRDFVEREGQKVVEVQLGADILKRVEANDFVISMRSFQGGLEWSRIRGSISSAYVMLIPAPSVLPAFFSYLFKSDVYIQALQSTTNLVRDGQALRYENFTLIDLPLIPTSEQVAIATFLDRETGKIDALVAEQEKLIDLLKEKRRAIILHAVTKGVNPDARMVQSGFEWLGDIPAHWNVKMLKWFSTLQRGYDLTELEREEGPFPVVTSGGIVGTHSIFMAEGPGVVTGRYGSTGTFYYIESNFWPHNTSLFVSNFHGNNRRFVWYSLQTLETKSHSAKSAVPGLDRNDLHVLMVAVPPVAEQQAIAAFLEDKTARIDSLVQEAELAISLLTERRSTLISSAVTGKVDVRGLAPAT